MAKFIILLIVRIEFGRDSHDFWTLFSIGDWFQDELQVAVGFARAGDPTGGMGGGCMWQKVQTETRTEAFGI